MHGEGVESGREGFQLGSGGKELRLVKQRGAVFKEGNGGVLDGRNTPARTDA